MNAYRERKGEEGEIFVYEIVKKVLSEMDYEYRVVRNAILPFESVYGEQGYITAEFDLTIFTPFFVFLIEIKNERYKNFDYDEPLWKLMNGDMVSNPINQNHTHKLVFCSEFNVPRERVISIEVLLENGKIEMKESPFLNDYIFDKNELLQKLMYLFATEFDHKLDNEKLYETFKKRVSKYNLTKEEHIEKLKHTEKIETRIRRVIGWINLRRTDIIRCNSCCSGVLRFRDMLYSSTKENQRASRHYALGCSNYKNAEINCSCGLIYVDANKPIEPYLEMKPIHIEEKNGWGDEKVVKTILDEINCLKVQNANMIDELKKAKDEAKRATNEVQSLKEKYVSANQKVLSAQSEVSDLKEKMGHFRRIFGSFYVCRD